MGLAIALGCGLEVRGVQGKLRLVIVVRVIVLIAVVAVSWIAGITVLGRLRSAWLMKTVSKKLDAYLSR